MPEDLQVSVGLNTAAFDAGINRLSQNIGKQRNALERIAAGAEGAFSKGASALAKYEVTQISLQQSTERVRGSQIAYNQALAQFGPSSSQAVTAQQALQAAQQNHEKVNLRARASLVLIAGDFVTLAAKAPRAAASIAAYMATLRGATAVQTGFNIAVLGGLGALAGIAAMTFYQNSLGNVSDAALTASSSLNDLKLSRQKLDREMSAKTGDGSLENLLESTVGRVWLLGNAFGRTSEEIQRDLDAVENRILELDGANKALIDSFTSASGEWISAERVRQAASSGSAAIIQASIDRTQERITALGETIGRVPQFEPGHLFTDDELRRLEEANKAMALLPKEATNLRTLEGALAGVHEEAARLALTVDQTLTQGVESGFGSLGIQISSFSLKFQEDLLAAAGVSEAFIATLRPAVDVEKLLAGASEEAREALLDQMNITADKDETTEEFIARLKELGLTEAEIKLRVDETGRALRNQADATRDATAAAREASSVGKPDLLTALLEHNKDDFIKQLYDGKLTARNLPSMDIAAIANVLKTGKDPINDQFTAAFTGYNRNDPLRAKAMAAIKGYVMTQTTGPMWDGLLKQMGLTNVPAFANGFDGIVSKPSLFIAGEAGPERMTITPMGKQHGGASIGSISIVVNARDGRDAGAQIARKLRELGV